MINLDTLSLFDIYGVERIPVAGSYTSDELASMFVDEWIPYLECHKCGRSSYCKFAKPSPHNPAKMLEIKCGVAELIVRNFVERTINFADALDAQQKQAYLDGAYYLTRFIVETEQSIGGAMSTGILDWMGENAPTVFGRLTHLRDILNGLGESLQIIPHFYSKRNVLFVEGWAEKAFLDKLRESHMTWFLDLIVECYDGMGNRKPKRIAMLLKKYNDLGYTVYAQGDADGRATNVFQALVDAGQLELANTFVFSFDFESAVPLPLLIRSMRRIGIRPPSRPSRLKEQLTTNPSSVNALLKSDYGFDLGPAKVGLANALGEILNNRNYPWWRNAKFMASELGRFLEFIQKMQ